MFERLRSLSQSADTETADPASERPIIIASLGRSGSTLLQRLLNAHPDIAIWGEHAGYLTHVVDLIENTIEDDAFRKRMEANTRYRDVIVGQLSDPDAFMPWAAPLSPEQFGHTIAAFVRDLFASGLPPGTRWGFKEIRYGRREYEAMRGLFPRATILVMIRDMAGYLRSRARAWRPNVAAGAEDERAAIREMLDKYATQWMQRNVELIELVDESPESYLTVPYDRLSEDSRFIKSLGEQLTGSSADEQLIDSVLSKKAGSSDTIAGDDWDEHSTRLLFDVVDEIVSAHQEARKAYERALEQSAHVLP